MRLLLSLFLLLLAGLPVKAQNATVSSMTAASALTGAELLYCVQSGGNRKCTPAQIATYVQSLISGGMWASATSNAQSSDYTTILGDLGKCIAVTTGSSTDKTITLLAAATAGDGAIQCIGKVDSGTNKAIVSNGADAAWLSNQWDYVIFRSDGSAWNALAVNIAERIDVYTSGSTNWTKPPLAANVSVTVIGGGGAGGNGSVGSNAAIRAGGSGGSPGCVSYNTFPASQLTSTVNVTVGAQVAGNAASSGTTGTAGTDGNSAFFGASSTSAYVYAGGGSGGNGATTSAAAPGARTVTATSPPTYCQTITGNGGAGSVGAAAGGAATKGGLGPGAGGGAGGVATADTVQNGGAGGGISFQFAPGAASTGGGGAAGATASCGAAGANGTAGTSNTGNTNEFGYGGGGGASCLTQNGGDGGSGGTPGGGGGGSGGSRNGFTSGASGLGARSEVRVVTTFR